MNRRRAEADNPPVNSRISIDLLVFAVSCWRLLERALVQWGQGLATCRLAPEVAASGRELWRVSGKNLATG
jgi:hypothetical protein